MPAKVKKPEGREQWRTVSEVAEYVGTSTRTIERWWKEGKLPEPERFGDAGTKIWSPQQCSEILGYRILRLPSTRAAKRRIPIRKGE